MKQLRLKRGLSQEDVAGSAYTAAYVSLLENGKKRPSEEAIAHFAFQLGASVEQLVSGRDPDDDLRLEITVQEAIALIHNGGAAEASPLLEAARDEARDSGNTRALLKAQEGIALALYHQGDWDRSYDAYTLAAEYAADLGPEAGTTARAGLARCELRRGKSRRAIHLLETHLIDLQAAEHPDPSALVDVYGALIPTYFEASMIEQAKSVAVKGSELAMDVAEPEKLACLYVNRAGLQMMQGQSREALASLSLAEDLYKRLGWHGESLKVMMANALALIDQNDLPGAERLLRAALGDEKGAVTPFDRGLALVHLAKVRRLSGDPSEGLKLAAESLEVGGTGPTTVAEAKREAGLCAMAIGDAETAVRYWEEALALYKDAGFHEETAKTSRLLGEYHMQSGDMERAAHVFRGGLSAMGDIS